jgi:hypothetical protein
MLLTKKCILECELDLLPSFEFETDFVQIDKVHVCPFCCAAYKKGENMK